MINKFWKWLAVFAYEQIKTDPKTIKYGIPGNRDIDNPCTSYSPGQQEKYRGFNHCGGDGHYLCKECRWYSKEE